MKIIRINQHDLLKEEWSGFYGDFKNTVLKFGADRIDISALFNLFIIHYEHAALLIEVLRKSLYTREIKEADRVRDKLFRGFANVAKGLQMQPEAAKREAAVRLHNLVKAHRKSILRGNYQKESATLRHLLQDLLHPYADCVATLGLSDWVASLEKAEADFSSLSEKRQQESVDKPKENLIHCRSLTDTVYNAIANVLDASLLTDGLAYDIAVNPESLCTSALADDESFDLTLHGNLVYNFVVTWNETVKEYHTLLAKRAARRNSNPSSDTDPE
jgi:hypothetical protein